VSSAAPVDPIVSGLSNSSSNLVMPDLAEATQTLTSLLALPIQENFEASNRAPVSPSSGSNAAPRLVAPMTVPSFGAAA
jgi:hypothetical protein